MIYEIMLLLISNYFEGNYLSVQEKAETYISDVIHESQLEGIDPFLIATNIRFESGWRANARGKKGEIGLTQIKTSNRKKRRQLIVNPKLQIREGVRVMKDKLRQCRGDVKKAFTAYISGKCKISKRGMKRYRFYKKYRKMFEDRFK